MADVDVRKPFDAEPGGAEDAPEGWAMDIGDGGGWYERVGRRWYPVSADDGLRLQREYLERWERST